MQVREFDVSFIGSVVLLLAIGTIILASVQPQLFPLQVLFIGIAALVFWLFSRLDKIILESLAPIFYALVVVLLLATLLAGVLSGGAVRWLELGQLTIQPSEFAKPTLALITAWVLSKNYNYAFLISLFLAFLMSLLVFIQPDLGTMIILLAAWFGAVLGSGIKFDMLLKFVLLGLFFAPLLWSVLAPYQKNRIISFIESSDIQGASYQSTQAMISAGSGGLLGRGLGQGSQTQLAFLPARHTDFVFSSIGEELGFVGMMLVVLGFFILQWRIFTVFKGVQDKFAKSALGGIFFYLTFQTFINISMNLGMVPIAGVPLPLISAGGSSLVSTMFTLGIVLALKK